MYKISLRPDAEKSLAKLKKCERLSFKKLVKLIEELIEHPYTGKPKPLGGDRSGQWSRRITDKHRLVYLVEDEVLTITILSASSHYDEK